jgi:hypothetical protein
LVLANGGRGSVDDVAAVSDSLESPPVISVSSAAAEDALSGLTSQAAPGFGLGWKNPVRLFWPLLVAGFDEAVGVGFCFLADWRVDASETLRFLSGEEEVAGFEHDAADKGLNGREDSSARDVDWGWDAVAGFFDKEAADLPNMSLMLLLL